MFGDKIAAYHGLARLALGGPERRVDLARNLGAAPVDPAKVSSRPPLWGTAALSARELEVAGWSRTGCPTGRSRHG